MGKFYALSKTKEDKNICKCDYVIYLLDKPNTTNKMKIGNISYFIFDNNNISKWDIDDTILDVLGPENILLCKFEKLVDTHTHEIWIKINE